MEIIYILILGGFVGFISAFLGLGGGVVIVPLLPEIVQLTSHEAVATSLFTIFLVVTNNCISFHRKQQISWSVALVVGPLTAVGAALSGSYVRHLPGDVLRWILTLVVLVVFLRAVLRLLKKNVVDVPHDRESLAGLALSKKIAMVGMGIFAGLLSGVSGIGAGLVISPLLIQLHLVRNERVSPTANAVMLFTTFFGALALASPTVPTDLQWGYIHLDKAFLLASGAFCTSWFARKVQGHLPVHWRLSLLTGLLFLLFLKMLREISANYL